MKLLQREGLAWVSFGWVCALALGLVSGAASAGVFDDAIWVMNPDDLNGDGVAQTGEIMNRLKGAVSDASHQAPCYGHDVNNAIKSYTGQTTRFLSDQSFTAYYVDNKVVDGKYFHGNANLSSFMRTLFDPSKNVLTLVCRVRCNDVNKNTSWILNNGAFSLGFQGDYVRLYNGGDVLSPSSASKIKVVKNEWIDLAVVASNFTVTVGGKSVVTGAVHAVCAYPSATADYLVADRPCCSTIPGSNNNWLLGTENLVTGPQASAYSNKKYYEGDLAQLAFWDRALTDDEIHEAFKTPQRTGAAQVGFRNRSGDEFNGAAGTATVDLDKDQWRKFPAKLSAGDVWTMKTTLGADEYAKSRLLTLETVGGAGAALSAAVNDGAAVAATVGADGTGVVFLPHARFVEGENTIVVTRTDAGAAFTLDALSLVPGTDSIVTNFTADATVTEAYAIPDDTTLIIDVAEGATVTWTGLISGAYGAIEKRGAGTLVLANTANAYASGTKVAGGTLVSCTLKSTTTTPFGTGAITVDQAAGAQLVVATSLANDIDFLGSSSKARTGIHFADVSALLGAVTSEGDLYLSTAWADRIDQRDTTNVIFEGPVTVESGSRIAGAPHCVVNFKGKVTTDVLEGYFADNAANVSAAVCKTRGNLGAFRVSTAGHAIKEIVLDQTRFVCGKSNFTSGLKITFTGEHLADGWGCFDLNGSTQKNIMGMSAPATLTAESEGCQIINSNASTATFQLTTDKVSFSDCYVKFDGAITMDVNRPITFKARQNSMSGQISFHSNPIVFDGCTFRNVAKFNADTGSIVDFTMMPDGALAGVTYFGSENSSFTFTVRAALFTPRQVALWLCGWHATQSHPSDILYVKGDEHWEVKTLGYKKSDENVNINADAGTYEGVDDGSGVVYSLREGTVDVLTGGEVTPIVYTGRGANFNDPASWTLTNGSALTSAPDFSHVRHSVILSNADITLPASEVIVSDLTLTDGVSVHGAAGAQLSVFGTVKMDEARDAGTHYVFDVPIGVYANVEFAVPTNGTFAANAGIVGTGAVTFEGRQQPGCIDDNGQQGGRVQGATFTLKGESTFAGKFTMRRGNLELYGTLGATDDMSTFQIECSTGSSPSYQYANVTFHGVTCNKKVEPKSVGVGANLNLYSQMVYEPGTTNVFNKTFDFSSSNYVRLNRDTCLVFNGSYLCGNTQSFTLMGGEDHGAIIFNGPMQIGYAKAGKGRAEFNGTGKDFLVQFNHIDCSTETYLRFSDNTTVVLGVDDPFAKIGQYCLIGTGATVLDLNGHRFTIDQTRFTDTAQVVGGAGSVLRLTGGSTGTSDGYVKSEIKDAVSLVVEATNRVNMVGSVCTSTGAVSVVAGSLRFDAGSSWANASAVSVGGTGTLLLEGSRQIGKSAVLELADEGVVSIPDGKRLTVAACTADGEKIENGVYTYETAPDALKAHLAATTGKLRVGRLGMVILVR